MRAANLWRLGHRQLLLLALLALGFFASSCRNNEVDVPPLTGPSGHRLFITMEARPDHLVIHTPGRPRETSEITLQLKNQAGIGVAGENVKLRIANRNGAEISIGRLSDYNVTTDSAGFARVIYTAPDSTEQSRAIGIRIYAILTNPAYPFEVTDNHGLDLELPGVTPGDCFFDGAGAPVAEFTANPGSPVINETVCFDASASQDDGVIVGFLWDFGDGSPVANGEVVCHEYDTDGTFIVTLILADDEHNCTRVSEPIVVEEGEPASCTIQTSPTDINVDDDVFFTAITTDPDGDVRRFEWNFGDGSRTSSSRNTITHRYRDAGSFAVLLTIIDDQGNDSTCTTTVTVQSDPPVCGFTTNPSPPTGNSPLLINFDSTSTDDTGIASFDWDFGDGTTASGPTVSHTFSATCTAPCAQNFATTLTVVDDEGNTTSCSATVTANNP